MADRFVNVPGTFLLPRRTNADPHGVSGARQLLLGAWLDVDPSAESAGFVPARDRAGNQGFVRAASLREAHDALAASLSDDNVTLASAVAKIERFANEAATLAQIMGDLSGALSDDSEGDG